MLPPSINVPGYTHTRTHTHMLCFYNYFIFHLNNNPSQLILCEKEMSTFTRERVSKQSGSDDYLGASVFSLKPVQT